MCGSAHRTAENAQWQGYWTSNYHCCNGDIIYSAHLYSEQTLLCIWLINSLILDFSDTFISHSLNACIFETAMYSLRKPLYRSNMNSNTGFIFCHMTKIIYSTVTLVMVKLYTGKPHLFAFLSGAHKGYVSILGTHLLWIQLSQDNTFSQFKTQTDR